MSKFYWTTDADDAEREQSTMRELIRIEKDSGAILAFQRGYAVGTAHNETTKTSFAVGVAFDSGGRFERRAMEWRSVSVDFPYIPGLLAFRVGPAICTLLDDVIDSVDLLLLDGQGIAHERGFGLAAHIGVLYNKPAIGVTRKNLFGLYNEPPRGRFNSTRLSHPRTGSHIGYALSLGRHCEPCFLSPGHKITLADSLALVCQVCGNTSCFPEPLRAVHAAANSYAKRPLALAQRKLNH